MDAPNHLAGGQTHSPGAIPREWRRGIALAAIAWLLLLAILLVTRRLAGAFAEPLPAIYLLALGIVVSFTIWTARLACQPGLQKAAWAPHWFVARGPTLAIVLIGVAVSIPHSNWLAVAVCWLSMAAADVMSLHRGWHGLLANQVYRGQPSARAASRSAGSSPETCLPLVNPVCQQTGPPKIATAAAESNAEALELPGDVRQQITRWHDEAGIDTITGLLRSQITRGERSGTLHVAFCPPFERLPELHVEQSAGPPARIKVAQLQPHGARFEFRLAEPCEAASLIALEFTAFEPAACAGDTNSTSAREIS